jgi:hypothetical protein
MAHHSQRLDLPVASIQHGLLTGAARPWNAHFGWQPKFESV